MATKTISIMNDVYDLLAARKAKGESFSDVLRKTLHKKRSIMEFAGAWSHVSDADIEVMKGEIAKLRKSSTEELLRGA